MPASPRIRQLRRDKTLFALALNTVRLHLEEEGRLAQQPHLREAPDAALLLVQQSVDQWVSLAAGYIMRKFRCSLAQALPLVGELQNELKRGIPVEELWQIPLEQVLALPPGLLQPQPEAAPAESQPTTGSD